jgi:hypothetical protein
MAKYQVTLGTNQRDRLCSRPASSRKEVLEVVAPELLLEAVEREKVRSWFIDEVIFIRVEPDGGG